MSDNDDIVFIYTTFANVEQARVLGRELIGEKLAGCVNIFPQMLSIYEWKGQIESGDEAAMIIKTRRGRLEAALARARELHPYETPALAVLPVDFTDPDYASWLVEATGIKSPAGD